MTPLVLALYGLTPPFSTRATHTPPTGTHPSSPLEGIALGWGQANIECGSGLIAEFDQVEGVTSEVGEKGVVEPHL